jgi:WhiB family transcriptional regulator, redox-sensing transcriptional regulator
VVKVNRNSQKVRPQFDWRLLAACRNLDPDLFFPIGTTGPSVSQIAEAKQVCLTCPVRNQCLNWAVSHYQDYGIWGGMTELERQALRTAINVRQRRPA